MTDISSLAADLEAFFEGALPEEDLGRRYQWGPWKDIADANRLTDLVFSVIVTAVKPHPDGIFVTLDVRRLWKGDLRRRAILDLQTDLDAFRFMHGKTYLVVLA